jgi:hypothetical protein
MLNPGGAEAVADIMVEAVVMFLYSVDPTETDIQVAAVHPTVYLLSMAAMLPPSLLQALPADHKGRLDLTEMSLSLACLVEGGARAAVCHPRAIQHHQQGAQCHHLRL